VNGPTPPLEVFDKRIVGNFSFVNVQTIVLPAAVATESNTKAPVAKLGIAVPAPIPLQLAAVSA
jgi:hypothetical protein